MAAVRFLSKLPDWLSFSAGNVAVGLSIGTSSIKLAELKKSGKSWRLEHFGIVQLPEEAIVNREIINQVAVAEAIRKLSDQIPLKTKFVCTSLSGTSVIIKRMSLEAPNIKDLQDQVFWEAEQYLPFDVSEVVMDYHMISRNKDNQVEVLLVAVKRSVLESYMSTIEDAGLKARVVDVDFFALQNLYELIYPASHTEAVALIDIGASSIKLTIVHRGTPVFTKESLLGGRHLTAEIQKHLNLSFSDAESLKLSVGSAGGVPQEVNEIIHVMSENFSGEIKRALDFYNASSTGAPVAYALLAGGGAKIPELSRMVEEAIKIPTQLMNPFSAIGYDESIFTPDYLASIAPIAAIPIGLALRAGTK